MENEQLLKYFVKFLNLKHRQTRNVFHVGARVQIVEDEEIITEFITKLDKHIYDSD